MDWEYWGKAVPSFGDPKARLLILGLAPAAHGANRTGRMFTGDMSGEFLYRTLHKTGFANQSQAIHRGDGLALKDCYITAMVHCAPPANKPTPQEILNCHRYLSCEFELLKHVKVIVALGRLAFDAAISTVAEPERPTALKSLGRPKFSHGAEYQLNSKLTLLASFHPSQQNTFTGKLTEAMFEKVFRRAWKLIHG
jgi:uracil-DNA glycosylase